MQRGVAKGLKVPCLFMITEVSIRCHKKPGSWYTPYTHVYPRNTPLLMFKHVYYILQHHKSKNNHTADAKRMP